MIATNTQWAMTPEQIPPMKELRKAFATRGR
jgi:hypothetical protein